MRVCMLFLKIYVTFVRREQKRMNKRENNMKRLLYLTVCLRRQRQMCIRDSPIPDGLSSHPGGVLWL